MIYLYKESITNIAKIRVGRYGNGSKPTNCLHDLVQTHHSCPRDGLQYGNGWVPWIGPGLHTSVQIVSWSRPLWFGFFSLRLESTPCALDRGLFLDRPGHLLRLWALRPWVPIIRSFSISPLSISTLRIVQSRQQKSKYVLKLINKMYS